MSLVVFEDSLTMLMSALNLRGVRCCESHAESFGHSLGCAGFSKQFVQKALARGNNGTFVS